MANLSTDQLPDPRAKPRRNPARRTHRRRLLERLSRISSSPQLSNLAADSRQYPNKNSISCISLYVPGPTSSRDPVIRVLETVEIPYGTEGETLRISVPPRRREPRDLWTVLPDEVKVQVLGYLEPKELVRCSAVSKKWHTLCFDGQLWSTLDATGYYNRIPVDQLAKIVTTAGPFVKNLNLRGCVQLYNDWREEAVWNACRNLQTASLEGCKITRTSVQFLIIRNPLLVQLNLSGLSAITNSICRLIAQSCFNLQSLNVSWCSNMDARGIKKIVDACRQLRELRACEVERFDETPVMQALFRTNAVERLHLGGCAGITDEAVRVLVEGAEPEVDPFTNRTTAPPRKLVHLDLSRCARITDSALRSMAGNVPCLEGLEVGGCVGLTDAGFVALLPTVGRLTHLDVEECAELTDATLVGVARGPAAKRMVHLQCSYCENMGDAGMTEVIRKCTGLRNLEMDNTRISDLILAEAAHAVRYRPPNPHSHQLPDAPSPRIALRLVIYDCASITWSGVRQVLARNVECSTTSPSTRTLPLPDPQKPDLIQLKCFYGWQQTVDEHLKRVLRGDLPAANRLETKWAEHMLSAEDGGSGSSRRRRRRAREAALFGADDDDFAFGGMGVGGFGLGGRRGRRGAGCVVS